MNASDKPAWERFGDAMGGWCGYVRLVPATALALATRSRDPAWPATTRAIVAATAGRNHLRCTRVPAPRAWGTRATPAR
jgi:hypothetical protein